jgi:1,4-dihydroxy-6-naphthoate synthase
MQMQIGFSPCPNDTFMLEAMLHNRIDNQGLTWQDHIADVETLNEWALEGRLDVTKMSFSTWLRVQETYDLLTSGAAIGYGCGPLVIAKQTITSDELVNHPVAIPGELTTANLLFTLRYPNAQDKRAMLFSDIETAVLEGAVTCGVIIHENRFTYTSKGLVCIVDLGAFWEELTASPIPLGAFAIKRSLGPHRRGQISAILRESVQFAFDNRSLVMPFVRKHAQEMDESVMKAHIDTYVNEFSLDLGTEGANAIELLRQKAAEAGIC